MFDLILKGVVTGFILSVMVGPVFFVLLETSIRRGARAGLAFDMGVFLSDVIYVLIAYLFYAEVKSLAEGGSKEVAKIIGGILFLCYGSYTFFKKPKQVQVSDGKTREPGDWKEYGKLCLKGFLLNFANPLVVFYWYGVLSFGDSTEISMEGGASVKMMLFLAIILLTFFSIDVLKIFGAKQLRPFITNRLLTSLNQLIGIVFVVFGIILVIQGASGR